MIGTILAIDCGSSSTRVSEVRLDPAPKITVLERVATPWVSGPDRGEIELASLVAALRVLLLRATRRLTARPDAIALTSVLGWVPLDEQGVPSGNAIAYSDRRAAAYLETLGTVLAPFEIHTGRPLTPDLLVAVDYACTRAKWTDGRRSAVRAPYAWTTLKDHLLSSLGADVGIDTIHAAYTGFLREDDEWREYKLALAVCARTEPPFAPPQHPDTICGTCTLDGELKDVPLVRGTSDGSAGFYALSALGGGGKRRALCVSGTTEVVMRPVSHPSAPSPLVVNPVLPSLAPGARRVVGGSTATVGGFLRTWAQRFSTPELARPATLEKEIGALAPGAHGLFVFPALEGERLPRSIPGGSAAVVGLHPGVGPTALVRAVYEAGAFRAHGILDEMRAAGAPVEEVWVSGGGSASDAWNRIRADVFGIPVYRLPWEEASTLGSAMIAYAAIGAGRADRPTTPSEIESRTNRWVPDAERHAEYVRLEERYRAIAHDLDRHGRASKEEAI